MRLESGVRRAIPASRSAPRSLQSGLEKQGADGQKDFLTGQEGGGMSLSGRKWAEGAAQGMEVKHITFDELRIKAILQRQVELQR